MTEDTKVVEVSIPREVLGKKHLIKQDTLRLLLDWFCPVTHEENFTTEQIKALFGEKYTQFKKDFEKILDKHLEG